MTTLYSLGLGVGTHNAKGEWLEIFYAQPVLNPSSDTVTAISKTLNYTGGNQAIAITPDQAAALADALASAGDETQAAVARSLSKSQQPLVATLLESDAGSARGPEAYMMFRLLTHRLVKPHGTSWTGIFGVLRNGAWTNQAAIDLAELRERQLQGRLNRELLEVACVNK